DTMDTINGTLVINMQGGENNQLELRDLNSFKTRNATLDVASGVGTISGFGPGTIKYDALKLAGLTVKTSNVSNVLTVANTSTSTSTTIQTGLDNDTVNVQKTGFLLKLDNVGGFDTVNFGLNNSMQGILGSVNIARSLLSTLNFNDQANT